MQLRQTQVQGRAARARGAGGRGGGRRRRGGGGREQEGRFLLGGPAARQRHALVGRLFLVGRAGRCRGGVGGRGLGPFPAAARNPRPAPDHAPAADCGRHAGRDAHPGQRGGRGRGRGQRRREEAAEGAARTAGADALQCRGPPGRWRWWWTEPAAGKGGGKKQTDVAARWVKQGPVGFGRR